LQAAISQIVTNWSAIDYLAINGSSVPQTIDEVRAILESGDFFPLVGRFEDQHIECKRQPYRLESEDQKLELAKDVSALANLLRAMALGASAQSSYLKLVRQIAL